jgi:hypothetical protein
MQNLHVLVEYECATLSNWFLDCAPVVLRIQEVKHVNMIHVTQLPLIL